MTYIQPRALPDMPLTPGHVAVGHTCFICGKKMAVGETTVRIPLGPATWEDTKAMRAGKTYHIMVRIIHAACAKLFDAIEV